MARTDSDLPGTPRPPIERAWLVAMVAVSVMAVLIVVAAWWDPSGDDGPGIDLRNGRAFIQDNLWTADGDQYAVWVDDRDRPTLGIRRDEGWDRFDLGGLAGNPLATPTDDDRHNIYVVAVDELGHVHVAGNMQADPLRYVRTAEPGRYDRWVEPDIGGPNESVTYPAFVGLPDGTLFFFRREGRGGIGQILADRLAPGAEEWEHLGSLIDGRPSGEGPYLQHVAVDPADGSLHLGWLWRKGRGTTRNNDVSYMRSIDAGTTWQTSDGVALSVPVTHASAEVVLDTPQRGSGLLNNGGMVIDGDGRPHLLYSAGGRVVHVWSDGEQWHRDDPVRSFAASRPAAARAADGSVWAVATRGSRVVATQIHPATGREVEGPRAVPGFEPTYDSQAMLLQDRVDVLVVPADGGDPEVVGLALDR